MKTAFVAALALVALVSATTAKTYAAQIGGLTPGAAISISFDGFCDGMTITAMSSTLVGGSLTGCYAGLGIAAGNVVLDFTAAPFSNPSAGVNMTSTVDSSQVLIYLLNFADYTWANYASSSGEIPTLVNQGTFTVNGVGPNPNGPPSGGKVN